MSGISQMFLQPTERLIIFVRFCLHLAIQRLRTAETRLLSNFPKCNKIFEEVATSLEKEWQFVCELCVTRGGEAVLWGRLGFYVLREPGCFWGASIQGAAVIWHWNMYATRHQKTGVKAWEKREEWELVLEPKFLLRILWVLAGSAAAQNCRHSPNQQPFWSHGSSHWGRVALANV